MASPSASLADTRQERLPVCAVGDEGERRILVMCGALFPMLTVWDALCCAPKGSTAVAMHSIRSPESMVGKTTVLPLPREEELCVHS